ncbi:MAG: hypothetical protein ABIK28_23130, partial [Planctomycetota bacterium]
MNRTGMQNASNHFFKNRCRSLYDHSTRPLILLSILWLFLLSMILPHQGEESLGRFASPGYRVAFYLLISVWMIYILDWFCLLMAISGEAGFWPRAGRGLLVCLAPAFRLSLSSFRKPGKVWIPALGWREKGRPLKKKLVKAFSVPMIFIVLLVLPVLGIEFCKQEWLEYAWVKQSLEICSQIIWFAFAVEFILIVSVAKRKLEYCVRHWLDLAIILLPVILFVLPFLSFLPIARLARLSRLARSTRMLRLKGVGLKAFQTLVLLSGTRRFGRRYHERRLLKLRRLLKEKEEDMVELKEEIATLEREQRKLEENGG